jgi:predicted RNase H-like nuclease
MAVVGVDACRDAWIGAVATGDGRWLSAVWHRRIDELVEHADVHAHAVGEVVRVVAIDIPIGLPDSGRRPVDEVVKRSLGKRSSTVFLTPTRAAIQEPDYSAANALQRQLAGEGLSRQAHALRDRILDVDAWVQHGPPQSVIEVHPERSFATMNGAVVPAGKKTWAGVQTRKRLLANHGILIPDDIGAAGAQAAVDDVLDAAAAAWTASRFPRLATRFGPADSDWAIWA